MKANKVLSLLGLSMKAGKAASGSFAVEKAVKEGSARVVLIAQDASDNTRKMFTDMCTYHRVPVYIYGTRGEIGAALGKEERVLAAVTDEGLGKAIEKQIISETDINERQ